ncbi:MAG: phosphoribosyl-AMP cyclohydrolase [Candidatus Methanoperedens sp.]|nr:phosphoribosyl-AMP cyclohydrolase [Candidatus Methanoperedens sp.]
MNLDELKFDNGLITAIAQDHKTKEVLMVAFMDREALRKTIETGRGYYFSRSRKKLWKKGESSGHEQSCFYRTIEGEVIGEKLFEPDDVYKR